MTGSDQTTSSNGDPSKQVSASTWDLNMPQKEQIRSFNEFANRNLLPDETSLMIKQFERASDIQFHRTYQMGKAIREFLGSTHTPQIGLVVLPGADLPEVNRLEQTGMVRYQLDVAPLHLQSSCGSRNTDTVFEYSLQVCDTCSHFDPSFYRSHLLQNSEMQYGGSTLLVCFYPIYPWHQI